MRRDDDLVAFDVVQAVDDVLAQGVKAGDLLRVMDRLPKMKASSCCSARSMAF